MIPEILVKYKQDGEEYEMVVEAVLFSMGRVPNVENMGCIQAGVIYDVNDGFICDEYLRTSNKDIYSVGDCLAARQSNKEKDKAANPGKGA